MGPTTPSKLISFKSEIKKVIDNDEDYVTIIKLLNENSFDEEVLGKKMEDDNTLFV